MFYTYAYLREDGSPYYIGKGKGRRISSHSGRLIKPPPKERRIYLKKGLTEQEALDHERYMIALYGRKDIGTGILRNLTDGGEGVSGSIPWNKGRSCDYKDKISKTLTGRKHSEEHKRNSVLNRKSSFITRLYRTYKGR